MPGAPRKNHLIFGFGVNDSTEANSKHEFIDGKSVMVSRCKVYETWVQMLRRCYSEAALKKKPSYRGCFVCEEWKYFSNFKAWMETQDWEGKHLDKDLLVFGNKEYGPEKCLFINPKLNSFITETKINKGEYATGVCKKWNKHYPNYTRFATYCGDPISGKRIQIGTFKTESEARIAYLAQKLKVAKSLGGLESDVRVVKALIERIQGFIVEFMST